jgi:sulfide dehydrogenase [flavocytochrome c] flavoprotein subunit
MSNINRRDFIKYVGATSALGLAGCAGMDDSGVKGKVVIIGGGFGGANCARFLKTWAPGVDVTLVERNKEFVTCPFSNEVIGGQIKDLSGVTHKYDKVAKAGINVIHDSATKIDAAKKTVALASGKTLSYDRLVVSPGIDFVYGKVKNDKEANQEKMPHAWHPGAQSILLRKQLEAMPDGGKFIMVVPAAPFRCPPGPFERASLVADYFKKAKPKSKIVILDANEKFSKQGLFLDAWKRLYPGMVEWVPGSKAGVPEEADIKNMTIVTNFEKFKGDVINLIPYQSAAAFAIQNGLTDKDGYCSVNKATLESTLMPGVHVLGDSTKMAPMPKSGFAAATHGKNAASAIIAALGGSAHPDAIFANTCYSMLNTEFAISVADVYKIEEKDGKKDLVAVPGGGVSKAWDDNVRRAEFKHAQGWYKAITDNMFG